MSELPSTPITPITPIRQGTSSVTPIVMPCIVGLIFLIAWHIAVKTLGSDIFPTPFQVAKGLGELASQGLLIKYVVASLFRVSWGFGLAVLRGCAAWPGAGLVQARVYRDQPIHSNLAPYFTHCLDSCRHPLVWRQRLRTDLSHFPRQRFSDHRIGHGGGAKHATGVSSCGAKFWFVGDSSVPPRHPPRGIAANHHGHSYCPGHRMARCRRGGNDCSEQRPGLSHH